MGLINDAALMLTALLGRRRPFAFRAKYQSSQIKPVPDSVSFFIVGVRYGAVYLVLAARSAQYAIAKTGDADALQRIPCHPIEILGLRFPVEFAAY